MDNKQYNDYGTPVEVDHISNEHNPEKAKRKNDEKLKRPQLNLGEIIRRQCIIAGMSIAIGTAGNGIIDNANGTAENIQIGQNASNILNDLGGDAYIGGPELRLEAIEALTSGNAQEYIQQKLAEGMTPNSFDPNIVHFDEAGLQDFEIMNFNNAVSSLNAGDWLFRLADARMTLNSFQNDSSSAQAQTALIRFEQILGEAPMYAHTNLGIMGRLDENRNLTNLNPYAQEIVDGDFSRLDYIFLATEGQYGTVTRTLSRIIENSEALIAEQQEATGNINPLVLITLSSYILASTSLLGLYARRRRKSERLVDEQLNDMEDSVEPLGNTRKVYIPVEDMTLIEAKGRLEIEEDPEVIAQLRDRIAFLSREN